MNNIKSCARKCSFAAIAIAILFVSVFSFGVSAQEDQIPMVSAIIGRSSNQQIELIAGFKIVNDTEKSENKSETIIEIAGEKPLASYIADIPSYDLPEGSLANFVLDKDVSVDVPLDDHLYEIGVALTDEELGLLRYVVDTEVVSGSIQHKIIIAQVIFNRVKSERFPNSVKAVLLSPNQFSTAYGYYYDKSRVISEKTNIAVDAVLNNKSSDLSQGALYFCSHRVVSKSSWFERALTPVFDMEGHRFYKY